MANNSFTLTAVTYDDIPTLAKISHEAFLADRHTQMKGQGKVPYSMEEINKSGIPNYLASEKCVVLKAIDNATGDIMGWACWGFRGFEKEEMPIVAGAPEKKDVLGEKLWRDQKKEQELKTEETPDERDESIRKLEEMTSADMKAWMEKLMPPGTKCMFAVGLHVAPAFQGRGAGGAFLKWATDLADAKEVFIWVHSSEPAWGAYAKAGFKVIGTLDVDLDEWAVKPPTDGTEKWGHYVFRYMRYDPKKN